MSHDRLQFYEFFRLRKNFFSFKYFFVLLNILKFFYLFIIFTFYVLKQTHINEYNIHEKETIVREKVDF